MSKSFSNDKAKSSQSHALGQSAQTLKPGLYVVATPLGNLRDITLRALDVLAAAAVIYCEDTRVTKNLLDAYGLSKETIRCDAHTETSRATEIAERVARGEIVALVSDAGTPGISDPGAMLVAACHALDVTIVPIPGPSAVTAALSASGMPHNAFAFLGFLPTRSAARRQILHTWMKCDAVLVLYEAASRVASLLEDIDKILGPRDMVIAREVTKKFETLYRGTPLELLGHANASNFKGEVALLIAPNLAQEEVNEDDIAAQLQTALQKNSLREAVAMVTAQTGLPRKTIYALALKVQRDA